MASNMAGTRKGPFLADWTKGSPWVVGSTVTYRRDSSHVWTTSTIIAVYSCTFSICLLLPCPTLSTQPRDATGQLSAQPHHEENDASAHPEFVVLKFLDFRWLTVSRFERGLEPWDSSRENQYLTTMTDIIHCPQVMRQPIEDIQYGGLSRTEKAVEIEQRLDNIYCQRSTDAAAKQAPADFARRCIAKATPAVRPLLAGLLQLLCISERQKTANSNTTSTTNLVEGFDTCMLPGTDSCPTPTRSCRSSTTLVDSSCQGSTKSASSTNECVTTVHETIEGSGEGCNQESFSQSALPNTLSMSEEIDHIVERKDEHLHEYDALCILSGEKTRVAPQLLDHVSVKAPTFEQGCGHYTFQFPGVLLEYLPGRTLRDLLEEPIEITELLAIQRAIVKAVHTLYEHGMYYADFHGGNIILDLITSHPSPTYHASIIDYGRWRPRSPAGTDGDPEVEVIDMIMHHYTGPDATAARASLEDHVTGRFADYRPTPSIHSAWHFLMTKLVWGPVTEAGSDAAPSWEKQYEQSGWLCRVMADEYMERFGANEEEKTRDWIQEVVGRIGPRFGVTEADAMAWFFKAPEVSLNHKTPPTPPYEAAAHANHRPHGPTQIRGLEEVDQRT